MGILVPAMKDMNLFFCGVRPEIKFNNSDTFLQCPDNWSFTTVATQLIPSEIGIVPCKYKIIWHWGSHIMVHLIENET